MPTVKDELDTASVAVTLSFAPDWLPDDAVAVLAEERLTLGMSL